MEGRSRGQRAGGKYSGRKGGGDSAALFDEMKSKSQYVQAIEKEIVQYDAVIRNLIREIVNLKVPSIGYLVDFVKSTESILSELTDETAVLKSYEWPKRYDTFREACALFKDLGLLKRHLKEWVELSGRSVKENLARMNTYMVSKEFIFRAHAVWLLSLKF